MDECLSRAVGPGCPPGASTDPVTRQRSASRCELERASDHSPHTILGRYGTLLIEPVGNGRRLVRVDLHGPDIAPSAQRHDADQPDECLFDLCRDAGLTSLPGIEVTAAHLQHLTQGGTRNSRLMRPNETVLHGNFVAMYRADFNR